MQTPLETSEKFYAEGATAPRITLDFLKSQIEVVYYMDGGTFASRATWTDWSDKAVSRKDHQPTTICMMVLRSGFVVLGQATPVSAANYDPVKGREIAYEQCIRQLWPLFGFAAKQGAKQ